MDSFMFMFHICILDLVQAAMHLVGGVYTLLPIKMEQVPHWLNAFSGGLISSAWLAYLFLSTVLAINRFAHVAFPHHILILISYLYALIWMIVYLTPFVNFVYLKDSYYYYYDDSKGSDISHQIDTWACLVQIIVMGICYLGVILMLRTMRKRMENDSAQQRKVRAREMQITLQVSIIFFFTFLVQTSWMTLPKIFPNMPKWGYIIVNTFWILINGINPVIYYVLNPTIRHKVMKLIGFKVISIMSVDRTTSTTPSSQAAAPLLKVHKIQPE
uniref:7TM GPCR serpentine receptor class x (Srx) domain-containing protein n=1 Tax=Plectus sambesii TaxID=2011161 RepID=A0A914XJH2_9BILA